MGMPSFFLLCLFIIVIVFSMLRVGSVLLDSRPKSREIVASARAAVMARLPCAFAVVSYAHVDAVGALLLHQPRRGAGRRSCQRAAARST